VWQEPACPNGLITHYYLTITGGGRSEEFDTDGPQTYLILDEDMLPESSGILTVEVFAVNKVCHGRSDCMLRVDPTERDPQKCTSCPERREGLVVYPATTAPEEGEVAVSTQCVENAEPASPSLEVSCLSSGEWRSSEGPQCTCMEDYTEDTNTQTCKGDDPVETPTPPMCKLCPDNITLGVTADCRDVLVTWDKIDGALSYNIIIIQGSGANISVPVKQTFFKIHLSHKLFKDKELSIKISAVLESQENGASSDPFIVDTKEFAEFCQRPSTETGGLKKQPVTTTTFSIALAVTFVITGLAVFFLTCVICLIVGSYRAKKNRLKVSTANTAYFDTPLDDVKEKNVY
jgi:hypothetical protein